MQTKVAIYLAGSIQKGHEKANDSFWTDADMTCLKTHLPSYSISFLNPALRTDNLSDQKSVFGRDMLQVFCSDIVFVDARERRGLGVGAEMMWAKLHKIPIITLAPHNSHYRKNQTTLLGVPLVNWIHPFIESLSDVIVDNLQEGAVWIDKFMSGVSIEIKDISAIESAMLHYQETQLSADIPMQELLIHSTDLEQKCKKLLTLSTNH